MTDLPLSRVVATNVARLLEERGMSGRALSRATGLTQKPLSRKLAGEVPFALDDLQPIADALDEKVSVLLSPF